MTRFGTYTKRLGYAVLAGFALATIAAPPKVSAQEDKPYTISDDGTIDWYTYNGFRRYHAECHVCHGPDAMGSSFAPALVESMKSLSYDDYLEIVVNGRKNVTSSSEKVMPSFGENRNVMCFIDDIYAYLKARADGVLPRGRPPKKGPKPEEANERDDACLG